MAPHGGELVSLGGELLLADALPSGERRRRGPRPLPPGAVCPLGLCCPRGAGGGRNLRLLPAVRTNRLLLLFFKVKAKIRM